MAGQAALEKSVLKALDDEADEKLRGRKLEESDFSEFRLLIGRALSGLDKDKVLDLVVSNDSSERACATCCPSLSPKLLHLMLEDTSQTVREMAAYRLLHPLHLFSEEGPEI